MIDAPKFIRSIYHLEDKVIFIILPFEDNIIVPFKSVLYVSIFIFLKKLKFEVMDVHMYYYFLLRLLQQMDCDF